MLRRDAAVAASGAGTEKFGRDIRWGFLFEVLWIEN